MQRIKGNTCPAGGSLWNSVICRTRNAPKKKWQRRQWLPRWLAVAGKNNLVPPDLALAPRSLQGTELKDRMMLQIAARSESAPTRDRGVTDGIATLQESSQMMQHRIARTAARNH